MVGDIRKTSQRSRYPWASMEVGEQFVIPSENTQGTGNCRQLCYAATKASEKRGEGKKFKSYKQEDGSVVVKREV